MNTTARKLSVFVLMAVATTVLTLGASTTFAANTHHHIQLMSNDDSWASSFSHKPNSTSTAGSDYPGSFSSTQYGSGSHPHHHHSSTDMIADINGANSTSTAGSDYPSWPSSFSSTQYGSGSHPHHHHSSTDMIADINGANSTSTAGSGDRGSFSSTQYGSGSHPHHHQNDMIVDIN